MSVLIPPYGQGVYGQAIYVGPQAMSVRITSPASGGTVTSPGFTVTWARTYLTASAAQNDYRLRIYDTDGATVLYDSTRTISASEQAVVPNVWDATAGATFFLRVEVTDDDGYEADSGPHPFETSWTTPVRIEGLAVRIVGDKCEHRIDLPRAVLTWLPASTGGGFTFIRYSVWRRIVPSLLTASDPTAAWVRIASITDIATTRYVDHEIPPYTTADYAVTWSASDGLDTFSSTRQSPPPVGYVEFDWAFVHDVADPTLWALFHSLEGSEDLRGDRAFDLVRGRTQPTAFIGEAEYSDLVLTGLPESFGGRAWRVIKELRSREHSATATLCVRPGAWRRRYFANIADTSARTGQVQREPSLRVTEVHFDEAVA